jgi:alkylhydroperoxidase family enzyme
MTERLGAVPQPLEALWSHPTLAEDTLEFSARVAAWDAADEQLKMLAHIVVAAKVGCRWCLDLNYFLALQNDVDPIKLRHVTRWRQSGVFSSLERDVLEYAEAMTDTPTTVTDELSARLLESLGPPALVEVTVFIAYANLSTRTNTAHGIASQGYSDGCAIPLVDAREETTRSARRN